MSLLRRFTSHALLALAEAGLISLLIVGLIAGSTLAASHKGGRVQAGSATLTVTPNPVAAYGAEYRVDGSGFKPGVAVNIVISMPTCCAFFSVPTDASGNIWFVHNTGYPGTYKIDANQQLSRNKQTLMGTTTFQVVSP